MAKKQDPNSLGAMMAAQNELAGINAGRLQNSQAEQAFLQQQQAANAVMMQAAQIGASGGVSQQVGGMNPQTQAILAQYGITGVPQPGKTTSSSRTTQSGGNIKIENKTTTNNDIKIVNPPSGNSGSDNGGMMAKFQAWLSNSFAKQNQDYEVQRRAFARRDRDLEKQSNKMMRQLEKSTTALSERLSPENIQKSQGNQLKTVLTVLLLQLAPIFVKPIADGIKKIGAIFDKDGGNDPKIIQSFKRSLGIDKNNTLMGGLGEIVGAGIRRLTDRLDLLYEDRKNAINSIKKPQSRWNKEKDADILWRLGDWVKYLGDVVVAGLGGSKSLAGISNREVRASSTDISTYHVRSGEKIKTQDEYTASELRLGDLRSSLDNSDFSMTGGIKNTMNSNLALVGTVNSMANNTAGIGYSSTIKTLMSKAKQSMSKDSGLILGPYASAKQFLKIFGADLEDFEKKGLVISKIYYLVDTSKRKDIWDAILRFRLKNVEIKIKNWWQGDARNEIIYDDNENHRIVTKEERDQFVRECGLDSKTVIEKFDFWELTLEGMKKLEMNVGGENYSFSDTSSQSYDLMHSALEKYSGKTLTRDVSIEGIREAESIHSNYINLKEDISNRHDAIERVQNALVKFTNKNLGRVWNLSRRISGGDSSGKYKNTSEGKIDFANDMMSLYASELTAYYEGKGLSKEQAQIKASEVAQWLTGQDALETSWGNKIIGDYNYGNIKKGSSWNGPTKEAIGSEWRSYSSADEYIKDKIRLLSWSKYKDALMADSLEDFTSRLQDGGYSASDTKLEYHNKVATMTDSISRRLSISDWDKKKEITPTNTSTSSENFGKFKILYNQNISDPNKSYEESIGSINVITNSGAEMSFDDYYSSGYSDVEKDLIKHDVIVESKRQLMYENSGGYSEFNTDSDLMSSNGFYLGSFTDVGAFSDIARSRLQSYSPGKQISISYRVYLTKDGRSWRYITTNNKYFNVYIEGQSLNTGDVLYHKNKPWPDDWYDLAGRDKNESYKNPLMSMLRVDLTPKALEALKDLLKFAYLNIKIDEGVVKVLDGEGENWRKLDSGEVRWLKDMGFIDKSINENTGSEEYKFTPKYRNFVETESAITTSFNNQRSAKALPLYEWGTGSFSAQPTQVAVNAVRNTVSNLGQQLVGMAEESEFLKGVKRGRSGVTEDTSQAEQPKNVTLETGSTYNDNSQHYTYFYGPLGDGEAATATGQTK